jgi:hypothetical protein
MVARLTSATRAACTRRRRTGDAALGVKLSPRVAPQPMQQAKVTLHLLEIEASLLAPACRMARQAGWREKKLSSSAPPNCRRTRSVQLRCAAASSFKRTFVHMTLHALAALAQVTERYCALLGRLPGARTLTSSAPTVCTLCSTVNTRAPLSPAHAPAPSRARDRVVRSGSEPSRSGWVGCRRRQAGGSQSDVRLICVLWAGGVAAGLYCPRPVWTRICLRIRVC